MLTAILFVVGGTAAECNTPRLCFTVEPEVGRAGLQLIEVEVSCIGFVVVAEWQRVTMTVMCNGTVAVTCNFQFFVESCVLKYVAFYSNI